MLSEEMKAELLALIIGAWNNQRGMTFTPESFNLSLEAGTASSKCTLLITSKRSDDFFNISASVKDFGLNLTIGSFRLTQRENFSAGPRDEVQVVDVVLPQEKFMKLKKIVNTPNFMTLVQARRRWYGNPETGQVYGAFGRVFGRA